MAEEATFQTLDQPRASTRTGATTDETRVIAAERTSKHSVVCHDRRDNAPRQIDSNVEWGFLAAVYEGTLRELKFMEKRGLGQTKIRCQKLRTTHAMRMLMAVRPFFRYTRLSHAHPSAGGYEIHVGIRPEYGMVKGMIWRLRSLYGVREASLCRLEFLGSLLVGLGFKVCTAPKYASILCVAVVRLTLAWVATGIQVYDSEDHAQADQGEDRGVNSRFSRHSDQRLQDREDTNRTDSIVVSSAGKEKADRAGSLFGVMWKHGL